MTVLAIDVCSRHNLSESKLKMEGYRAGMQAHLQEELINLELALKEVMQKLAVCWKHCSCNQKTSALSEYLDTTRIFGLKINYKIKISKEMESGVISDS